MEDPRCSRVNRKKTKPRAEALVPFEIVHQRPIEVATEIHARASSLLYLQDVVANEAGASFFRLTFGDSILSINDRQPVTNPSMHRCVEKPAGMNAPAHLRGVCGSKARNRL